MGRYSLKKAEFLSRRAEIRRVYSRGEFYNEKEFSIVILRRGGKDKKVGFIVGKKIGSAVYRNRAKRILKEVYRLNKERLIEGVDILFIAKRAIGDINYREIEEKIMELLAKANILK